MTNGVEQTYEALRQQQNDNPLVTEENVFSVMEDAMDGECPRDAHGCKACERRGLPILPLRRGTTAAQLSYANWVHEREIFDRQPGGNAASLLPLREAIEKAALQRRVLRQGYLYVYLQRRGQPNAQKVVQAYQVTEQGHFRSINPYNMRRGRPAPLPAKCTAANHDIPAAFITVDDVRYERVWLAFANDCWPAKVINDYKAGQQFDARFMALDIDALKQGNNQTAYGGMLRENDVSFLKQVLEYTIAQETIRIFSLFKAYPRGASDKLTATQSYVNSTIAAYQRAKRPVAGIAAVVVPDPVGEVLETNYLRNALILDRKKWNSSELRSYKYATSVEIAKIREAKIRDETNQKTSQFLDLVVTNRRRATAAPTDIPQAERDYEREHGHWREAYLPQVRQRYPNHTQLTASEIRDIDQRAGEYYDIAQRRAFNNSYAAWNNRFIDTINKITQTYVNAFRAEDFQRVAQYDYTDDDAAVPDNRVSATSFMRMVARCLDGGPSDLAQYDTGKNDLSLGPLVYKRRGATPSILLWQDLLGSYDSLFAKALFRRTPQIDALLEGGIAQEKAAQQAYETLLDSMGSRPYSASNQAQLDAAVKGSLLDQVKAMHGVVAGIVKVGDEYKKWQDQLSLQRIRQALSVAANSAMAEVETLNETEARRVELERARSAAQGKATQADVAKGHATVQLAGAQAVQRAADEKAAAAKEAARTQSADTQKLQSDAEKLQTDANRIRDTANAAADEAQKAQTAADEAARAQTRAQEQLQEAQRQQRAAEQALARERARANNAGIGSDPMPPRTGKANNMLRYSVLLYENKAVTQTMVITSTDDLKKVYSQLEDYLTRIHEGHGGKLPVKGRTWWRLTSSTRIKWRFFTEVSIPARYFPSNVESLAPQARAAAVQRAIAAYKADAGHNEFAGSSSLTRGNADAQAANRHRRTVFKMLAPIAYGQQGDVAVGVADGAGAQGSGSVQELERAAAQARENARTANAELEQAKVSAQQARQDAAAKAEQARVLNGQAGTSEAQKTSAVKAAQDSAEKLAAREAELAVANGKAQAASDAVTAAQADLDAKTRAANGAGAQQRRADADVALERRRGAVGQAGDTINSAKLGAALDIVSIILLWQSLNNACKAIDNSSGEMRDAAYFEFFSASVGIASSAMTLTGGTIEGVLAYRQPLTLGTGTAAYTLARNLTRNGVILGAVTNMLDASASAVKASNAAKMGDNPQVAQYYNLAAACSVTAAVGSVLLLAGTLGVAVPVIGGVVALVAGTAAAIFVMVAESKRTKPLEGWMKRCVFGKGTPPQRTVAGFAYKWNRYEHMNSAFQALKAAWMGLWPQLAVTGGTISLHEKYRDDWVGTITPVMHHHTIRGVEVECKVDLPSYSKEKAALSYYLEVYLTGRGANGQTNRAAIVAAASHPYDLFSGPAPTRNERLAALDVRHNNLTVESLPAPSGRPHTTTASPNEITSNPMLGVWHKQLEWAHEGNRNIPRRSVYDVFGTTPSSLEGIHTHVVLDTDAEDIRFVNVRLRYWPDRNDPEEFAEIDLPEVCSV
ncbi:T6SS effector BTH_I2691 family protein [Saezia sanguinis]|uniref:T6SS effector BTH_I2691 family protein n=1 Tax=Saezia sanguinis TaxID=1965230 RepID=UPI00303D750E